MIYMPLWVVFGAMIDVRFPGRSPFHTLHFPFPVLNLNVAPQWLISDSRPAVHILTRIEWGARIVRPHDDDDTEMAMTGLISDVQSEQTSEWLPRDDLANRAATETRLARDGKSDNEVYEDFGALNLTMTGFLESEATLQGLLVYPNDIQEESGSLYKYK
jgi:hypothetical protein